MISLECHFSPVGHIVCWGGNILSRLNSVELFTIWLVQLVAFVTFVGGLVASL